MKLVLRMITLGIVCAAASAAHAQSGCERRWSAFSEGIGRAPLAMAVFDDGSGPALYVGGEIQTAGSVPVHRIARWDGEAWSDVGGGVSGESGTFTFVAALTAFDDGSGLALYAGGRFSRAGDAAVRNIARWDGDRWSQPGTLDGPYAAVSALQVFDDGAGPALYAAGSFETASGLPASCVARWDGTRWHPLGEGLGGPTASTRDVFSLAVFDDGAGPALYAGGRFAAAGGEPASRIAKWDGAGWSPLGSGIGGETPHYVRGLAVFDDGSGDALYVGGYFTEAGGIPASRIAKWDGSVWSTLGDGMGGADAIVGPMVVFDDGAGPALYASGKFDTAGAAPVRNIAKWDGAGWSSVGGGLSDPGSSLGVFDLGVGPALYACGEFQEAGGVEVGGIARWDCDGPGCYADCDGDGELTFFDFLCFQTLFTAEDPLADCDGSGQLDFFDFLCFQNAFAAGCE